MNRLQARLLFATLLTLPAVPAMADSGPALYWQPPETRMDGSPLPESDLDFYTICASQGDSGSCLHEFQVPAEAVADAGTQSKPLAELQLPAGLWQFKVKVQDSDGLESDWSASVSYPILYPPSVPLRLEVK